MILLVFLAAIFALAHANQPKTKPQRSTIESFSVFLPGPIQDEASIPALRESVKQDKTNLRAWHALGVALEKQGDINEARKAHETAAKLGDKLLNHQLNQVHDTTDFEILLKPSAPQLALAAESALAYMRLETKLSRSKREEWTARVETLTNFAEISKPDDGTLRIYTSKEVDVRARILSKPEPQYTEEARKNVVSGTVILTATLAANGKVMGVRPMKSLGSGLTAQAIRSAYRIKFVPAQKDGQPVSMMVQLEYGFFMF